MKKLVTVFGPGECNSGEPHWEMAFELGSSLAIAGFAQVNNGFGGIAEAASRGARKEQGSVIAVVAEVYVARGREQNDFSTRTVRVKSAVDALMELIDLPDAFLAIGPSPTTLLELLFAVDYMAQRFIPEKPILCVGMNWQKFIAYAATEPELQVLLTRLEHHETVISAIKRLEEIFGPNLRLPDLNILQSTND